MKRFLRFFLAMIFGILFIYPYQSCFAKDLDWTVVNRFPVFKDPEAFTNLENEWRSKSSSAFLSSLSPSDISGEKASNRLRNLLPIRNGTCWKPQAGNYDRECLFRTTHAIKIKYSGDSIDKNCTWFLNDKEFGIGQCKDGKEASINESEASNFSLGVQPDGEEKIELVEQKIDIELILALGDSFASGEGNPDFAATFAGKEGYTSLRSEDWFINKDLEEKGHRRFEKQAEWWDRACHRSLLSWPALFALERAINNPKSVIQFASFACSGAEVYDGFFRPQTNPPGFSENATYEVNNYNYVPGVETTKVDSRNKVEKMLNANSNSSYENIKLKKSQLNASIELLCENGLNEDEELEDINAREESGTGDKVLEKKVFYGSYQHYSCSGKMRKPTLVLLSFGGNDFGFGGVVKWGVMPQTVESDLLKPIRKIGLHLARKFIGVIKPTEATDSVKEHMEKLYKKLQFAITNHLGIDKQINIYALKYPDPLPTEQLEVCSERLAGGNAALGQFIKHKNILFGGWVFRIEGKDIKIVRESYIKQLRCYQQKSFEYNNWHPIDADWGFDIEGTSVRRTWCETTCKNGSCPPAESFAWKRPVGAIDKNSPLLADTKDWEAYDQFRTRGLRTANDAVLTQATFYKDKNGKLRVSSDWYSGLAHPTASVHAAIADRLARKMDCLKGPEPERCH